MLQLLLSYSQSGYFGFLIKFVLVVWSHLKKPAFWLSELVSVPISLNNWGSTVILNLQCTPNLTMHSITWMTNFFDNFFSRWLWRTFFWYYFLLKFAWHKTKKYLQIIRIVIGLVMMTFHLPTLKINDYTEALSDDFLPIIKCRKYTQGQIFETKNIFQALLPVVDVLTSLSSRQAVHTTNTRWSVTAGHMYEVLLWTL